jgi:hypothetical protein
MQFPNRVWFDTGNGKYASRNVMPPDGARRDILQDILTDDLPLELVEAGNLRMAELWDACRLFQETNRELKLSRPEYADLLPEDE